MAQQLRDDPGAIGLTTGLGWYVTKHSIGLWSTTPPERGFAKPDLAAAQAAIDAKARPRPSPAPPVRRPWTAGRSSMTGTPARRPRSEEHTSELQSLMRI